MIVKSSNNFHSDHRNGKEKEQPHISSLSLSLSLSLLIFIRTYRIYEPPTLAFLFPFSSGRCRTLVYKSARTDRLYKYLEAGNSLVFLRVRTTASSCAGGCRETVECGAAGTAVEYPRNTLTLSGPELN